MTNNYIAVKFKKKPIIIYLGKEFGGGGIYVRRLCESLDSKNIEHEIYTYFSELESLKRLNNCNVNIFKGYYVALFKTFFKVLFGLKSNNFLLVPTDHISVRLASLIRIFRPFLKIIYILQCSLDIKKDKIREIARALFYLPISAIIGNSESTISSVNPFVKKYKYTGVIHYGLDYSVKKDFTKIPNTSTVLLPGRLVSGKGHLDLLSASKGQSWNILFAGDGYLMKTLKRACVERSDVKFLGWVKDMSSIYLKSSVVVLPSISEGFGLVLLEAMSVGRPVICYNTGATPELVKHEKTGLLVDVGDTFGLRKAILRILNDREFAEKISYNAYKFVWSYFTKENMAKEFMDVISFLNQKNKYH